MRNLAKKAVAAMMAVWAAWTLGSLARDLGEESALAQALEQAVAETKQEIAALENEQVDVLDLAESRGYVFRGDIVFFDGG